MKEKDEGEDGEPKWMGPLKAILALFLLLLVVLWLVPYYSVKINPEPNDIPGLGLVQSEFLEGVSIGNNTASSTISEAASKTRADDPIIRQSAAFISSKSCAESRVCHAKALYYFVRDNIRYVSDPDGREYIASPIETLKTGSGDCDDGAVLLANLLEAVGIRSQIVVVPGHAMVKAAIPEAPKSQLIDGWVYMDWTCTGCRFGEVPYQHAPQIGG